MAMAEYRLLEPAFLYNKLVLRGSVIKTDGPPGPHLEPLNEEAHAAFKAWCMGEFPEIDKDGVPTGKKVQPRMRFYRQRYEPQTEAEQHEITLVSGPPPDLGGTLELAAVPTVGLVDTNQRPGPAPGLAPLQAPDGEGADIVVESEGKPDIEIGRRKLS